MSETRAAIFRSLTSTLAPDKVRAGRLYLILAIVFVVLGLVGWWIHATVERSLRKGVAESLQTVLDADVAAVREWVGGYRTAVEQMAQDPEVQHLAERLSTLRNDDPGWPAKVLASPELNRLREILEPRCRAHGFESFTIIDADFRFVADSLDELIGKHPAIAEGKEIERLTCGKTIISKPFLSPVRAPDDPSRIAPPRPMMVIVTCFPQETCKHLLLGFRFEPETLARILSVARSGETGETYAFDSKGIMLTGSRFEQQLKEIGLIPNRNDTTSVLSLQIRDPEADLVKGERARAAVKDRPLTRMASAAIKDHGPGFDVSGYRDYRGVYVVGAWTWLDDLDFGVGTQIDKMEAFRPVATLRAAFLILYGLLVVAVLSVAVASRVVVGLRQKADHALGKLQKLGQYTLEKKIGEGSMGTVYVAWHALLRRQTAVKLINLKSTPDDDVARFEREVRLTSQLTHPNTIAVYDYGRSDSGVFYYAMEYLRGFDLFKLVTDYGPLPEERVIHLMMQVCGSLHEAHWKGLVHRDVKPANIIVAERGGVFDIAKVLDFGLAKPLKRSHQASLTSRDVVVGTPHYLSPEVANGMSPDARADIYAVGCVMYYLLSGHDVFVGDTVVQILMKHIEEMPTRPSKRTSRNVGGDLEDLIMECLEKDPDDRPQTARELAGALRSCKAYGKWTQDTAEAWWRDNGPDWARRTAEEVAEPRAI